MRRVWLVAQNSRSHLEGAVDEEIARVQCIHMLSLARTHHGWIRRNDAAQSAESIYTAARRS